MNSLDFKISPLWASVTGRTARAISIAGFAIATLAAAAAAQGVQRAPSGSEVKHRPVVKTGSSKALKPPSSPVAVPTKAAESPVTVTVKANSEVAGAIFTLGEIAEVHGDDKLLVSQLSAIEIGASPLPGLSRIINPGDVTVRLRQHHLDVPRVDVVLPPGMRITRSGHDIAADEIAQAALESAKDAIKNQPDASLEVVSGGSRLMVASGRAQVVAGAWRGSPDLGTLVVPVSILVDGKQVQTVEVSLRIHRKMMALVARHTIQLHDVIGPADVGLMSVDVTSVAGSPVTSIEDSLGKRTTRRIPAQTAILTDMLEKAPLIAANEAITIEIINGALRITAAGIARQAGGEGDTIHVYATDTRKELDAIVIDKHTVRVEDAGNR